MKLELVRAVTVALLCAIVWLLLALIVALPTELFDGDVGAVMSKFMDEDHQIERVFFLLLILADVVIDAALGHSRFARWSAWASAGCAFVYMLAMLALPLAGRTWNNAALSNVFLIGMACLLFIRWASFFEVKQPDWRQQGSPTPEPAPTGK